MHHTYIPPLCYAIFFLALTNIIQAQSYPIESHAQLKGIFSQQDPLVVEGTQSGSVQYYPIRKAERYDYNLGIKKVGGGDEAWGFLFGGERSESGWKSGYAINFKVFSAGEHYYSVWEYQNGTAHKLVEWTPTRILKQNETNRFRLIYDGHTFALIINNEPIAILLDAKSIGIGDFGFQFFDPKAGSPKFILAPGTVSYFRSWPEIKSNLILSLSKSTPAIATTDFNPLPKDIFNLLSGSPIYRDQILSGVGLGQRNYNLAEVSRGKCEISFRPLRLSPITYGFILVTEMGADKILHGWELVFRPVKDNKYQVAFFEIQHGFSRIYQEWTDIRALHSPGFVSRSIIDLSEDKIVIQAPDGAVYTQGLPKGLKVTHYGFSVYDDRKNPPLIEWNLMP